MKPRKSNEGDMTRRFAPDVSATVPSDVSVKYYSHMQ